MSGTRVTAVSMVDGVTSLELGIYESVQLTGRELRSDVDEVIAWLDDGYWRIEADLRLELDIIIEEAV